MKTSEEIFELSTEFLVTVDSIAVNEELEPVEVIMLLVFSLGRLVGHHGKLEMDLEEHWATLWSKGRAFFDYAFNVERDAKLEEAEEESS